MRAPILTALACIASLGLMAQRTAPGGGPGGAPGGGHGGPVLRSNDPAPAPVSPNSGGNRSERSSGPGRAGGGQAGRSSGPIGRDQAPGFAHSIRPVGVPYPRSENIIMPSPMARCTLWPTTSYWQHRDIMGEIQAMARSGYVPTYPDFRTPTITGRSWNPSGWVAYSFVVAPKGKLHVRLHHPNEGWFRLVMMDRWGITRRQGMLQNLIPTGNPEVSYNNPSKSATTVYVIVDDPAWMSQAPMDPFVLNVDRDWKPDTTPTPTDPPVFGIWAKVKDKAAEPPASPAGEAAPKAAADKPAPAA